MGYASYIYEIVTSSTLKDEDDDQLFYTKIYLDEDLRVIIQFYLAFNCLGYNNKKTHISVEIFFFYPLNCKMELCIC